MSLFIVRIRDGRAFRRRRLVHNLSASSPVRPSEFRIFDVPHTIVYALGVRHVQLFCLFFSEFRVSITINDERSVPVARTSVR